jgi:hypothetical protein
VKSKFKILSIEELEDGDCLLQVEMDPESMRAFAAHGIVSLLKEEAERIARENKIESNSDS